MERILWSWEKVFIVAGYAKLVNVRVVGNWREEGFVESMLPEEQNLERKLVLPETIYHLTGKESVIFV